MQIADLENIGVLFHRYKIGALGTFFGARNNFSGAETSTDFSASLGSTSLVGIASREKIIGFF